MIYIPVEKIESHARMTFTATGKGITQYPVDGTDRRDCRVVANSLRQKLVSDLPGEDGRVFLFEVHDFLDYDGRGHLLWTNN